MFERRHLLDEGDQFKSFQHFCNALNHFHSTAGFMFDVFIELLGYSHNVDQSNYLHCNPREPDQVASDEASGLIPSAANRKRKQLSFFNSTDGIRLRISVNGHLPQRAQSRYCTLCGQSAMGKACRGHRSNIYCSLCSVYLCLCVHPGFRKSC